jgi:hypothetical protein
MRLITALAMAAALPMVMASTSFAMSDNTMMSGHENTMKMAKCPARDPAVIFNTTKKTYMLDNKKNRTAMTGLMSHDKFICKSQAEKMGGKMAGGASSQMMQKSGSMTHK